MTLVLELSPETEAQLRADAQARQVPIETLAVHAVELFVQRPSAQERRTSIAATLRESSARLAPLFPEADAVASFLEQKRADAQRDAVRDFGAQ